VTALDLLLDRDGVNVLARRQNAKFEVQRILFAGRCGLADYE
jgi:hypothetical protein